MVPGANQEALPNDYNDSNKLLSTPLLLASHKKLLGLISFHSSISSDSIHNTFIPIS